MSEDDSSLEDEFSVLDSLDAFANKLRDQTFNLADLQVFYSIRDLFAMEDSPFLDAVIRVRDEIDVINSTDVAKFVRSTGLGWGGRADLLRELKKFGRFVMTGTGLGNDTETVDSWVHLFIRR